MQPSNFPGDAEIYSDYPFTLKIHQLNRSFPAHVHHFIEYTFAIKGKGIEIIDGNKREIVPGTFSLLFPHQVHAISIAPGDELHLYVGAIGLKAFFGEGDSFLTLHRLLKQTENDPFSTYALDKETANSMQLLLQEMLEEINEEKPWGRMMFLAKLIQMLILFDRYRQQSIPTAKKSKHIVERKGMWEVIYYIYQNFKEPISLEMLEEKFNFSASYISQCFKKMTGENYYQFLERIRIAHACNLLIGSDMNITDIAYEVGFRSYSTFNRVFHQHTKMSPSNYRKTQHVDLA